MNLAAIGQLDLLEKLYSKITIAQAVYTEIALQGAGMPGSNEVQTFSWIETKIVKDRAKVLLLQTDLDIGESETIVLAIELRTDLLLMDERLGRAKAASLGLKHIGILGILIEAKRLGYVSNIKQLMDDLMVKAGFWIDHKLYLRVLQAAGEAV
jgi:predicted nucleic acid-binding protein